MSRLTWNDIGQRFFETGLDRGVLYLKSPVLHSSSAYNATLGEHTFEFDYQRPSTFKIGAILRGHRTNISGDGWYFQGVVIGTTEDSVTIDVTEQAGPSANTWEIQRLDVAVPWNGLTAVDEEGAEKTTSYYIDGVAFLHLPKPKQFAATLKAYTFPDEFSLVQGVAEAADGFYVDSQQMDSFNLCYRTRVGNDLEGINHGYKIHLVYNATVAPQGTTYQTQTAEINPSEFSWEIQAVPVHFPGYRPTAHFVIDTRHMDSEKLAAIEELLYGDESSFAQFPEPQALMDTLTYGDEILVIDHGDGTWSVKGSYENVVLLSDGEFQLNNINSTDLGDGTYTISSTP